MTERQPELRAQGLTLRGKAAVAVGRILFAAARMRKSGGTSLPGKVALAVEPSIIAGLAGPLADRVLAVTGTNGKTTTSRIISHLLRKRGLTVLSNDSGANIPSGIATSLLMRVGRELPDVAVLETDEKALPVLAGALRPRLVVVTNLLRDQLDRAGEPEIIARGLSAAFSLLPLSSALVLNADDPMVAALAIGQPRRVVYFGMQTAPPGAAKSQIADTRWCPQCEAALSYTTAFYAHLGHYECKACGFARPNPEISAVAWDQTETGSTLHVSVDGAEPREFQVAMGGLYNGYNALAAVAALHAWRELLLDEGPPLDAPPEIQAFGRMEWLEADGKRISLNLIKNPTGAGEAIGLIGERGTADALLFALNDLAADGRDVSWIWDAPFEPLAAVVGAGTAVCSGTRAGDAAIRLKYAGIGAAQIRVVRDPEAALAEALGEVPLGGTLVCLVTYTALLQLRAVLVRKGWARPFWEV